MMRLSTELDRISIRYKNKNYWFDRNEPGYTTEDIVLMTLKKYKHMVNNDLPIPCALCKVTIVYFDEIHDTLEQTSNRANYICKDCYTKIS